VKCKLTTHINLLILYNQFLQKMTPETLAFFFFFFLPCFYLNKNKGSVYLLLVCIHLRTLIARSCLH